jgi:hypothetical protein
MEAPQALCVDYYIKMFESLAESHRKGMESIGSGLSAIGLGLGIGLGMIGLGLIFSGTGIRKKKKDTK